LKEERGFFVKFGDASYTKPFETLKEARKEARVLAPTQKLKIYHGTLKRINDTIIDDSKLELIPRLGGYET
jgi:putative intracellular protease/amidase